MFGGMGEDYCDVVVEGKLDEYVSGVWNCFGYCIEEVVWLLV